MDRAVEGAVEGRGTAVEGLWKGTALAVPSETPMDLGFSP